ncbi:bifunctional DNA primase/polymerase, partial [Archangium sp.]|uniref:bifunctional DNA primase/polymerase n=1 Tax=Archangium sp. TaxID=1872627 RepID=UPI002D5B80D1
MRAADLYQQRGWRVLPLHSVRADGTCTCEPRQDGKPCQNKGKHPRQYDWVNLASSDPDALAEWRARYPGANVGIATGFASGFFVLDVDPKNGGDATLARLLSEHGPLPVTAQQATPSGGAHYLFRMPAHPVSNAKVGEGLDIRGDGGQIVAAPSRTTAQYRWVRAPWDTPVAEAPAWLLALLGKGPASPATRPDESARGYFPPASPAVLDAAREALEAHGPAVDGDAGGLHTVHAAAILTHDFALSDDEAWPLFLEWNETCQPPWELEGANSLREKFNNGRKYGKAEYGCKRSMDALETARKRIADWRERDAWLSNDGERDQALENLVREARQLVERGGDPLTRERIQSELIAATGLKA